VRNLKLKHPWRDGALARTRDSALARTRDSRFAEHLQTLPAPERQKIEAAERAYVARAGSFSSLQRAAARDHARGLMGIKENVPRYFGLDRLPGRELG